MSTGLLDFLITQTLICEPVLVLPNLMLMLRGKKT